ncbi:hypothetical protein ABTY98_09815 [Streptomyces sp. NPDC096040]|uniref:hypothetical protein n=1 Tax=Streptomyces sp. NPDC096040 TaxID=3155541 RepID=UPI00332F481C
MTHRLENLERVIGAMSVRDRAIAAQVFATSEQPILRVLARELLAANAIEAARLAEIETELIRDRTAESEAASADLPAPGTTE